MTTIAIIGAGNLGGLTAYALAQCRSVGRVILIDQAGDRAEGTALDIRQSGAIARAHARVEGHRDLTRAVDCDVCVLADPSNLKYIESGEFATSRLLAELSTLIGNVPLVIGGTEQVDWLAAASRHGVAAHRLLGAGAHAMVSAVGSLVALEADCSSTEVSLVVLGTPAGGWVVPWQDATVGGVALVRVLSPAQIRRIESRISRIWPPGAYVLATAASQLVESMLTHSRVTTSVITMVDDIYGIRGAIGAVPAVLSASGVADPRLPPLDPREKVRLETALETSVHNR
jgi:malate/lactate dehydrogenase